MQINEDYKLESDELNVVLIRRRVGQKGLCKGEEIWEPISYHTSLKSALKDYVLKEVNNTNMESLKVLADEIEEINNTINRLKEDK